MFNRVAKRLRESGHEVVNPAELDEEEKRKKSWVACLRRDIPYLLQCDAVAVLPGWQNSKGANLEIYIARALEMPILDAESLEPLRETILEEASRLVDGPRISDYGHPAEDFSRTALMWNAFRGFHGGPPMAGKVGRCSRGALGLITSERPQMVTYPDGSRERAWIGVHLTPEVAPMGSPWSSRDPHILGNLSQMVKPHVPEDVPLYMVGVKLAREVHRHKRDSLVDGAGYLRTLEKVREAYGYPD